MFPPVTSSYFGWFLNAIAQSDNRYLRNLIAQSLVVNMIPISRDNRKIQLKPVFKMSMSGQSLHEAREDDPPLLPFI